MPPERQASDARSDVSFGTHIESTDLCDCFHSITTQALPEIWKKARERLAPKHRYASIPAKATVAAFAASEGHAHPRVVELPKTEEGLGFNVMGGKEQNSPIYISRIIPGGVADRHGGLKRGDQLLSVNGVSVEGEPHEKAVELLRMQKKVWGRAWRSRQPGIALR